MKMKLHFTATSLSFSVLPKKFMPLKFFNNSVDTFSMGKNENTNAVFKNMMYTFPKHVKKKLI